MRKRVLRPVLLLLPLGLPFQSLVAEDLPKPFNLARYQVMMDRSPFAVATAVVAPVAAPNFAKDLYIANAARAKEGDMITLASGTDKNFKKYLATNLPPMDGYAIVSIDWSDKVGATKVTISKDGQSATLGFNEALLRQSGPPGQNPGAQPPGFQPPQPDGKGGGEKQDNKSAAVTQIPSSTALVAPPQSANPNASTGANPVPVNQNTKAMPVPMVPPNANAPRVRGMIPRNPSAEKPPGSQ